MIKRFCDWCRNEIDEFYLMPKGETVVFDAERHDRKFEVGISWVGLDGVANGGDFHRSCVQRIVQNALDRRPELDPAAEELVTK